MKELISVIIPVYNVENYLKRCIDSIITQTYKNIEIIIVNDGSTDGCQQICEEYQRNDTRIKLINKENGGLSDARNKGLKYATGKYIGFVDSDDFIENDMYETLYTNLVKTDADISICNYLKIKESSEKINKSSINAKTKEYTKEKALELLIEDKIESYAWNKLYKKELFEDIQFPKNKKMEDLAIMYKIFDKTDKIVYTEEIEYYYIQREDSILGNIDLQLIEDLRAFVQERFDYILNNYSSLRVLLVKNRLRYVLIYHRNLCEIKEYKLYKKNEYLMEYQFFKDNFKTYQKEIFHEGISSSLKLEYNLLYYNRTLFKYYYEIKKALKKWIKIQ